MVFCFSGLKIAIPLVDNYFIKIDGNRMKGNVGTLFDKFYVHKNQR